MRIRSVASLLIGAVCVSALVACVDDAMLTGPEAIEAADVPPVSAVTQQAAVEVIRSAGRSPETIRLTFHLTTDISDVASVQGQVVFPAGSLELVATDVPTSEKAELFMANTTQFAEGIVRFAALAPDRLEQRSVLTLEVKPAANFDASRVEASLTAVGRVDGEALEQQRLGRVRGVQDAVRSSGRQ